MRLFSHDSSHDVSAGNPLVPVIRPLGPTGKQALYAAANSGALNRRSWQGCAFNRAGELVGESVQSRRQAAQLFDTSPAIVSRFISVWDQLGGSNEQCTALLRDAILTVGLFADADRDGMELGRQLMSAARECLGG